MVITILHDPNLIIYNKFVQVIADEAVYDGEFAVVISRETPIHPYVSLLSRSKVVTQTGIGIADGRRAALYHYVEHSDSERVLLADFDRLLYWLTHDRESFYLVLENAAPITIVGRTAKAFSTHPEPQRTTEQYINKIAIKPAHCYDIVAGTLVLDKPVARYLLNNSHAIEAGAVDIEWIALMELFMDRPINYMEVDGLGYEGKWLGLEQAAITPVLALKRQMNMLHAAAMVNIINTWRSHL